MKKKRSAILFFVAAFSLSPVLAASELIPLEELKPLDLADGPTNKHSFQYGLSAANTGISDSANLKSGFFLGSYRPYFRYLYNETYLFSARGRVAYEYNNSLTAAQQAAGQTAATGLYGLELFNAEFRFGNHKLVMGRSFFKTGRGLLFANFADGVEYSGVFRYAKITAMGSYSAQYSGCALSLSGCGFSGQIAQKGAYDVTPGRTIDANLPNAGKRFFASLEAESPQVFGSSAYALAFYSYDLDQSTVATTDASTGRVAGQRYTFNPLYFGLGFSGYVVSPRIRYLAEGIYETGSTYNKVNALTGVSEQSTVRAWGFTFDLNYALPVLEAKLMPGLIFQYATGSGRNTAAGSGANTANAAQENLTGSDTNLFYFGYYSAGLALKPKLSNLHIFRWGFQLRPLNHYHWGRNFMTVFKYSYYLKQVAANAISDPNATMPGAQVGQGLDAQLVYDFTSDLKFFYAYGAFIPGAAYATGADVVQIHILSVNLIF
ncbi:MAG: alginate export family protein [Spirochaetes bacterium]|nr:alginate export family protein [Spirochaetota bacterium]